MESSLLQRLEQRCFLSAGSGVLGANGVVIVTGTAGADVIGVGIGSSVHIFLNGQTFTFPAESDGTPHVVVNAGDGDDTVSDSGEVGFPNGMITLNGGKGRDHFLLDEGVRETISGGDGDDTFSLIGVSGVRKSMDGGAGTDTIDTFEFAAEVSNVIDLNIPHNIENVIAGPQISSVIGNDLPNRIEVRNDSASPGYPGITMLGNGGNDTLIGSSGDDSLDGGSGNDLLDGALGADVLKGGAGNDTVTYASRTGKLSVGIGVLADDGESGEHDNVFKDIETVIGGGGNDAIRGTNSNNVLIGGAGNDTLIGLGGRDALFGQGGNDFLDGGADNDFLDAGEGNDTLIGGSGADTMNGWGGDDVIFAKDSTRDTVNGGSGRDKAQRDSIDSLVGIDSFIA